MEVQGHRTGAAETHRRLALRVERAGDRESSRGNPSRGQRRERHRTAGLVNQAAGACEATALVCRAVERGRDGEVWNEDRHRQRCAWYASRGVAIATVDAEAKEVVVQVERQEG